MLERLFDTDRYAALAAWVRERRAGQRQRVEAVDGRTALLLARAEQAVAPLGTAHGLGIDGTTEPTAEETTRDVSDGATPAERVAALRRGAALAAERALADRAAAQARLEAAEREQASATALAALRAEHAALVTARDDLVATAEEAEATRRLLHDAVRAEPVAALAAGLREAASRREAAAAHARAQTAAAGPVPADVVADLVAAGPTAGTGTTRDRPDTLDVAALDDVTLRAAVDAARQRVGGLTAVAEDAATLVTLDAEAARLARAAATARAEHERLTARLAGRTARLETLRVRLAEVAALAAGRPVAQEAHRAAAAALAAAQDRDRLLATEHLLTVRGAAAQDAANTATRAWLDARERRLDGMAAELAAALRPGEPCGVCGSRDHPAPAAPDGLDTDAGIEPVTAAHERALHGASRAAEAERDAAARELAGRREQLAAVAATADGLTQAAARVALDGARARLATTEAADQETAELTAGRPALEAEVQELGAAVAVTATSCEQADAELARVGERAVGLRERVDKARGDHPSVAARRGRLQTWADVAEAVLDTRRALAAACSGVDRAVDAATTAAVAAGFDDVDACAAAVLSRERTDAYTAALRTRDDELAAVTARLEDPAVAAAAAGPDPQPAAAAARLELARADDAAAVRVTALAEEAVRALDLIAAELDAHLAASAPVQERFAVLDGLSRCLDGTGGENSRRMPLSAFVLAARLEQVAEAASLRLAQMSGGRYALVHSDGAEKGSRRSGLALQVVDAWTGLRRDTASLSGGEAFYTSLALALGLADVVSAEAGGTTIETLFVDEGFGGLDEDTLEEVLDVLDDLRSGGRVVGLVSHVADLRDRMPARLEVVKGRGGSSLRLAVPA